MMTAALPTSPIPPQSIGRVLRIRAWRGSPSDLMAVARRMRAIMLPQYEKALGVRRDRIDEFYDGQIADAHRTLQSEHLGAALQSLLRAKTEAKSNVPQEIAAQGGYTESFFVTMENDTVEQRAAEGLFTNEHFPPRVRAVTMIIRSISPSAQVTVILANANPYVPQLEVALTGDDPGWVEGSLRALHELLRLNEPLPIRHYRWWIQPYVLPLFAWALFAWFLAVLIEYSRFPVLSRYSWLAIFLGILPAAASLQLLNRAIPPFEVHRGAERSGADAWRAVLVALISSGLLWLLGRLGLWLGSQSTRP